MGTSPAKTRQQLEIELLEVVRQRQQEWTRASDETRDIARERFIEVLHLFNNLVIHNKLPGSWNQD